MTSAEKIAMNEAATARLKRLTRLDCLMRADERNLAMRIGGPGIAARVATLYRRRSALAREEIRILSIIRETRQFFS